MRITDKSKKLFRNISLLTGSFTVTLLLLFTLVIPIINREQYLEPVKQNTNKSVGDWDNETEAYHYWYAPENSFGIQDMRTVNWSFFKEKFTKHTYWRLQYKRYEWNDWTNGNQYLTVNRTWNESGFWKINLTFTAPVDVYEARFIFACNLSVLQYVEKDDYEVWLNYSFNATENISIMFNWSDLTQYQNLYYQKGVQNGKFYFLFGKQNIHAGEYVFDPNFGYEGEGSDTCTGIEDRISGSPYTISEDGTAENISVYLMLNDWADIEGGETVKCMLYNNATNALVGETETMELSMANGPPNYAWYTFWFTNGSEPSLSSGTSYMITVWADDSDGDITSMDNNDGLGYCERNGNAPFNGAPDPHGMVKWSDDNVSIYCTYSTAAGETWNETESWNITLTNGTFVWDDHNIESWNITLTNGTFVWDDHNINSWNVTLVNGTFDWEEEIESWNTTLVNLTWDWTGNNIESWNVTLTNGTFVWDGHDIESWNVTLVNSSAAEDWENNIESWNITLTNGTFVWDGHDIESWNTTLVNLTWDWTGNNIESWNVTLTNGSWSNNIELWNVTLVNSSVDLITISNVYPGNSSINIPLQPTMYLTINHTDGETMNLSWYYGSQGSENTLLGSDTNFVNSTQSELNYNASDRVTDYYWRIMVDDGSNYYNYTYSFKTEGYGGGGGNTPSYMIPLALSSFAFMFGLLFFIRYRRKRRNA